MKKALLRPTGDALWHFGSGLDAGESLELGDVGALLKNIPTCEQPFLLLPFKGDNDIGDKLSALLLSFSVFAKDFRLVCLDFFFSEFCGRGSSSSCMTGIAIALGFESSFGSAVFFITDSFLVFCCFVSFLRLLVLGLTVDCFDCCLVFLLFGLAVVLRLIFELYDSGDVFSGAALPDVATLALGPFAAILTLVDFLVLDELLSIVLSSTPSLEKSEVRLNELYRIFSFYL